MTDIVKPDAVEILKEEIKKSGLKKEYVARQSGTTKNYLSNILNGKKPLSISMAVRTSKVLGLPLDFLLQ